MRVWPEGSVFPDAEALGVGCAGCGAAFRVHRNLAGYRMRCADCGAWIDVPRPAEPTPLELEVARTAGTLAVEERGAAPLDLAHTPYADLPRDEAGVASLPTAPGEVYEGDLPSHAPLAPGTLRHVRADVRQRHVTRTILEIGLMVLALLVPFAVAHVFLGPGQRAILMPLSGLVGGLGVILVGLSAPHYTFSGLCWPRRPVLDFVKGAALAGVLLAVALGWRSAVLGGDAVDPMLSDLREALGHGGTLVVIALFPALFEELAFRGLLQGRLKALFGHGNGLFLTAVAFALAHGVGPALPILVAAGLVLGWLRENTGSLAPGMLLHGLYNAGVVEFTSA